MGPRLHLPLPSSSLLAVGIDSAGPTPQIQPLALGAFGEKKRLCRISPLPVVLLPPSTGDAAVMNGAIVRVIGITGCTT